MTRVVGLLRLHPQFQIPVLCDSLDRKTWLLSPDQLGEEITTNIERRIVSFRLNAKFSARLQPVDFVPIEDETDLALLEHCVSMEDERFWLPALRPFMANALRGDTVRVLRSKLQDPELSAAGYDTIVEVGRQPVFYDPEQIELRGLLSEETRWKLIADGMRTDVPIETLEKIRQEVSSEPKSKVWNELANDIHFNEREFSLLPTGVQRQQLETVHRTLFHPFYTGHSRHYSFPAQNIYSGMTRRDIQLAKQWAGNIEHLDDSIRQGILGQMVSARGAEIAARMFYQSLGYKVADVAMTQLSNISDEWKTHDLALDGETPLDVKNARTPYYSKQTYTEHIVPRFKRDRYGEDVRIVGVVSPFGYCNKSSKLDTLKPEEDRITVLGETSQREIDNLVRRFGSALELLLDQKSQASGHSHRSGSVIPLWVFDYPGRFYDGEWRAKIAKLAAFTDRDFPTPDQFALINKEPPVGLLLAVGRSLPKSWRSALQEWQWNLYHELIQETPLSLPYLFLSILTHFVKSIGNPPVNYSPSGYRDILMIDRHEYDADTISKTTREDRRGIKSLVVAVQDPMNSLRALCSNLLSVWRRRDEVLLDRYTRFRFMGLGILQALKPKDEYWTTLIAYCGGETDKKVKCGYPNLVIGKDETCSHCRRLICPMCGFCQWNCEGYLNRRAAKDECETSQSYPYDIGWSHEPVSYPSDSAPEDDIPF